MDWMGVRIFRKIHELDWIHPWIGLGSGFSGKFMNWIGFCRLTVMPCFSYGTQHFDINRLSVYCVLSSNHIAVELMLFLAT